jgi:hypothetical protein
MCTVVKMKIFISKVFSRYNVNVQSLLDGLATIVQIIVFSSILFLVLLNFSIKKVAKQLISNHARPYLIIVSLTLHASNIFHIS